MLQAAAPKLKSGGNVEYASVMWIRWLNILALVGTITVNTLANTLTLNGKTTGQISNGFDNPIAPAGYVFSIWSVIYLALIAFAIYQALPSQRDNPRIQRLGLAFVVSCIFNGVWIFAWHYDQFYASLAIMLALAASLIVIWKRLDLPRAAGAGKDYWLVSFPFIVYLGWITVATFANLLAVIDAYDIALPAITRSQLAIGCIGIATLAALWVGGWKGAPAYAGVVIWAAVGIAVKQDPYPAVVTAAWVATAVAGVAFGLGLVRARAA